MEKSTSQEGEGEDRLIIREWNTLYYYIRLRYINQ